MKRFILGLAALAATCLLHIATIAHAAPTSTIVQSLRITGLGSSAHPCVTINNSLGDTATSSCGSGSPNLTTSTQPNTFTVAASATNATITIPSAHDTFYAPSSYVASLSNNSAAAGVDFSAATGTNITAALHSLAISQFTNDSGYLTSAVQSVTSSADLSASAQTGTNVSFTFKSHNVSQFTNDSGYLTAAITTIDSLTNATQTFKATAPITISTSSPNTHTIACPTCLTANQTITLSQDVSGSGPTSITATVQGIQTKAVTSTAPTDHQVLLFVKANSDWEPATIVFTAPLSAATSTSSSTSLSVSCSTCLTSAITQINGISNSTTSIAGAGNTTVSSSSNVITISSPTSTYWQTWNQTVTRSSNASFKATDSSNASTSNVIFTHGRIVKWLEQGVTKTAMVTTSTYASGSSTVTIIGDTMSANFSSTSTLQYSIEMARSFQLSYAGTIGTTASDTAGHYLAPMDMRVYAGSCNVGTAGSTATTTLGISTNASSSISCSISTGATTTLDVAPTNWTAVSSTALFSLDINAVNTTPAADGYFTVYYMPNWNYLTP